MIKPFSIEIPKSEPVKTKKTEDKKPVVGLDFSSLSNVTSYTAPEEPEKKKRGRKKKDQGPLFTAPPHMGEIITDGVKDNKSKRDLSFLETNEPYESKFAETNAILRSAIVQLDNGLVDIQRDIEDVRSAKTLRNKYNHLTMLQGSMGTFISNKINAAKELNSTISKCNEMELKRYKEMKASAAADQDDDQKIMEMYKAFVNVPASNSSTMMNSVGQPSNPLGPSMIEMSMLSDRLNGTGIGSADAQYQNYVQNLTPQQNMMLLEGNPDIKQVVVYNQETGARYFEVMNLATGEVVPNAEKHDAMFLEDVTIDQKNMVARNTNLGETYPLVVVGQPILNEY